MGDLLTSVRDRLDESTASFWTDAQLARWINEGNRNIARVTEATQVTATVSVTAGTQTYSMPSDLIQVNRIEYVRTGDSMVYPLEFRENNTMDEIWMTSKTVAQATPCYYTLWGYPGSSTMTITLFPTPSSNGTLTVYYYQFPAEVAATATTTTLVCPNGWEDLIVDYTEFNALRRDADPRWQEAKSLYDAKLEDMMGLTRQWSDQETFMAYEGGGGVNSWLYGGY